MDRTYWRDARLATSLSLAGFAFAACGGDGGGNTMSSAPTEEEEPSTALECSVEGSTKACTCGSGGSGRKTCKNGAYGSCASCVVDEVKDAGPRDAPSQPKCRAGYYTGEFTGKYKPGAFGFGIGESLLEVDVAGVMSNGRPALAMTLEESVMNSGGEFFTFTVGNGCMTGVAQAVGTSNPFVARLSGDLDCSTGAFVGTLEGKYTLLDVMGLEFSFKGPLTAQFDLQESALEDGKWSVDEPPALTGQRAGGGEGTWGAKWTSMTAPNTGDDPCKDIVSTGPADAGALTNGDAGARSPDAGVP